MIVHINEYHNKYTNTEKYKIHLQLIVIHLFWKSSEELSIKFFYFILSYGDPYWLSYFYLGLDARKPVFRGLWKTKAQTSLRIWADLSAPLFFAYWKVSYLELLQAKFQFI